MRNPRLGKKRGVSISFLAFLTLYAFVQNSTANEEKPGAQLSVEIFNGATFRGELLAVQGQELVIALSDSFTKVNLHIDEIKTIRIVRKSNFLKSLGIGLLMGGGTGALIGFSSGDDPPGWFSFSAGQKALIGGFALGLIGSGIGGLVGAISGMNDSIEVRQLSEKEKIGVLGKLQLYSRFQKEYPSLLVNSGTIIQEKSKPENLKEGKQLPATKIEPLEQRSPVAKKISRFHLAIDSGFFYTRGTEELKGIYKTWGFANRTPPVGYSHDYHPLKNIQVEYSITNKLAIGLLYTKLGRFKVQGYNYIKQFNLKYWFMPTMTTGVSGLTLTGEFNGDAYFLTAAFMPVPDGFLRKDMFKVGGGLGLSDINLRFIVGETIDCSKKPLSIMAFAECDHFFNTFLSFGLNIDYKFIPFKINSFRSIGYYHDSDAQYNDIVRSMIIDFSRQTANFGGLGWGINFGLHL